MKRRTLGAVVASGLLLLQATAHAVISSGVNIDFQGIPAAVYGAANLPLASPGVCAGAGNCYFEDGMVVGVVDDPVGFGEHIHRAGAVANRSLAYHADSSGIYLRADDGSAFALSSLDFNASITIDNPDSGPGEEWEILGFSAAENPALASGNGTTYANRVAYQIVPNGFNGPVTLNVDFANVKGVWIHYKGYPGVPAAKDFSMTTDNLAIGPAVVASSSATRKVPALGLWMTVVMAGGLMLIGCARNGKHAGQRAPGRR